MLCLKQQMSEEPTEDDLDEEEFIESSDEQYLNRSDDEQAKVTSLYDVILDCKQATNPANWSMVTA
jgi:hypothetical protein